MSWCRGFRQFPGGRSAVVSSSSKELFGALIFSFLYDFVQYVRFFSEQ